MTTEQQQEPSGEQPQLEALVETMTETAEGVELEVRFQNPSNRALHYIGDVRGMIFDPATRQLRVQLSDRGRQMPPGGIAMQPQIRSIDPNSEALLTIRLPKTIVKLSNAASPTGEVVFEEHAIADADIIELEIGWTDTPYYRDPRESSQDTPPVASWEDHSVRVTYTPGSPPPRRRGRRRRP